MSSSARAVTPKYLGLGGLNNRIYCSRFWRPGVQSQGKHGRCLRSALPLSLCLMDDCILALPSKALAWGVQGREGSGSLVWRFIRTLILPNQNPTL